MSFLLSQGLAKAVLRRKPQVVKTGLGMTRFSRLQNQLDAGAAIIYQFPSIVLKHPYRKASHVLPSATARARPPESLPAIRTRFARGAVRKDGRLGCRCRQPGS
ncbi:hypothetical protein [Paracoccus thiocyanatus]|uniref:hypothetical protein n=1 Tax=Paracoccus thiocyanatus TaxID=34006 RepID=UPI001CB755C4|nr:hypothetical protein [Paracoccus thiocyanatus]